MIEKNIPKVEKNDQTKNPLVALSGNYIELLKLSWEVVSETNKKTLYESHKYKYSQELDFILNQYSQNLFPSEDGCILAKFALLFGQGVLSKEKVEEISENLSQNKDKYPILSEIDQKITFIDQEFFDFFTGQDKKLDLFIPVTNNPLADVLISTEIGRLITNQNTRPNDKGPNGTFSTTFNQSSSSFEIILSK